MFLLIYFIIYCLIDFSLYVPYGDAYTYYIYIYMYIYMYIYIYIYLSIYTCGPSPGSETAERLSAERALEELLARVVCGAGTSKLAPAVAMKTIGCKGRR